ncbi:MAG: hypothetical protein M3R06_04660, partial [Chloroflexota bacterium]|nr:hypothetical protein [Chloroflexota bacterium]
MTTGRIAVEEDTAVLVETSPTRPSQPFIPGLRPYARAVENPVFAHPAEHAFSRILSFYGIRWAYEPTTFALAWMADGRPLEMLTPDFFLPDQRLYIELTTMRQALVTRKNGKVRRLRQLYPNVRIKLLYRRDLLRLLACYQAPERSALRSRPGELLFDVARIQARVDELARAIATDFAVSPETEPLVLLRMGCGAAQFQAALSAALKKHGVAHDSDWLGLTRYRAAGNGRGVRVQRPPRLPLAGRKVLLIDSVVSTGLSLGFVQTWLRRQGVGEVSICALLDRRAARLVDVPLRYVGFDAPNEVLVGFGLSLRQQYRDLPGIA